MTSRSAGLGEPPRPHRHSWQRQVLQVVVGLGLAAAILIWGLPHFAKTTWSEVFQVLGGVHGQTIALLLLIEVLGLYMYTFTLTGSLPGLRHTQALIVNVCGSSIGNLLPGGGAAGLAATYTICRSWGFQRRDISISAIVTGVWNVLARVALPILGIIGLLFGGHALPPAAKDAAIAGGLSGLLLLGAFVAILVSQSAALLIGRLVDHLLRPVVRRLRHTRAGEMTVRDLVIDLRGRTLEVVRTGWLRMTFGMVGFFGMYYLLFWVCMRTVGIELSLGTLFAAYAIGRLLTAVGITPGGLGVTETGTAAALVALGAPPAEATAGVVLFSIFTHIMELPLGALGWLLWSLSTKSTDVEADHPVEHEGQERSRRT